MSKNIEIKVDSIPFKPISKESKRKTLMKVGFKLAEYILTKAPTPPIQFGTLRGSVNVRVENLSPIEYNPNNEDRKIEPVLPGSQPKDNVIVFMGVPYAKYMHRHKGDWGKDSKLAGNVGRKFITKKVKSPALQKEVNEIFTKGLFK